MQQRTNEALQSAVEAERDFRRLANECQSLLDQLRRGQSSYSPAEVVDLSPMTPTHPTGMMMIHHYVQQQQQFNGNKNVQATFDFASFLNPQQQQQQQQQPKIIKSSFKTADSVSHSKSISFGPITTYPTSPLASPVMADDQPAATSTLKKSCSILTAHPAAAAAVTNPIQADFNHQNSQTGLTTKNL